MSHTPFDKPIVPLQTLREVKANSFIFEQKHSIPPEACAEIIRRFEAMHGDQYQGRVGQQADLQSSIKKTTDIAVSGKPHWQDVDKGFHYSLGKAMMEFRETFPYFKGPFKDIGYNIQRYNPGEYYHWHIDGGSHDFSQRQLVALWYLNDVPAPGGETQFLYQDVSISPEAGKLVLFPPFWTHEHRAATVQSGVKYIATTWVVFA